MDDETARLSGPSVVGRNGSTSRLFRSYPGTREPGAGSGREHWSTAATRRPASLAEPTGRGTPGCRLDGWCGWPWSAPFPMAMSYTQPAATPGAAIRRIVPRRASRRCVGAPRSGGARPGVGTRRRLTAPVGTNWGRTTCSRTRHARACGLVASASGNGTNWHVQQRACSVCDGAITPPSTVSVAPKRYELSTNTKRKTTSTQQTRKPTKQQADARRSQFDNEPGRATYSSRAVDIPRGNLEP